jgi:hypothetical protein
MIMRGVPLKRLLAAAGIAAAVLVAGIGMLIGMRIVGGHVAPAVVRSTARSVLATGFELPARVLARTVQRAARCSADEAYAQGRMQFESTPEESARAFDERLARRRATRASTPPVPAAPGTPEDPEDPLPPDAHSSGGDIVRIGSDIKVEEGQTVDGDVVVFGADARIDGHVRGNVSVTRGDLYLGSTARVDGDVLCFGGEIHEDEGASVTGQRVTGLQRGRSSTHTRTHVDIDRDWGPRTMAEKVMRRLTYLLAWLLLAWALIKFAPGRTAVAMETLRRESSASFGFGFALMLMLIPSVVALALVIAILCITIIGIPVAFGVIVAYAGLLIVIAGWGYVVGATALGERLAGRGGQRPTLMRSAVVGVMAIQGAMLVSAFTHGVPVLGWMGGMLFVLAVVTYSVVTLLGIGALIRSKFGLGPQAVWWPPHRLFGAGSPPPPAYPPPPPPPAGYHPPAYGAPGAPQSYPPAPAQSYPPAPPQTWAPPATPPAPPTAPPPGYTPPASPPPPGYGPPPPSSEPPPPVG